MLSDKIDPVERARQIVQSLKSKDFRYSLTVNGHVWDVYRWSVTAWGEHCGTVAFTVRDKKVVIGIVCDKELIEEVVQLELEQLDPELKERIYL